jgi:hypothetical protein
VQGIPPYLTKENKEVIIKTKHTTLHTLFDVEDKVFIENDPEQWEWVVTCVMIGHKDTVSYEICCGNLETVVYEFQLSPDKSYK